MRWGTSSFVLVLIAASSPAAAQVLVGPSKLRAQDGSDTGPLERAIEDAVWRAATRVGAIVSDLKPALRTKILACGRDVRCLGESARGSGARLLLVPAASQEGSDLVVNTYVIAIEQPRLVKSVSARWPEPRQPEELIASVHSSMKDLGPLLRGELLEEQPPAPPPVNSRPDAGPILDGAVTIDAGAKPLLEAASAPAEAPKPLDFRAWAQAARDRASEGAIALSVAGDVVAVDLAELIVPFGDTVEERSGLAPYLDEPAEPCKKKDHCVPEILDRTKAREVILFVVKKRASGINLSIERLGRREGAVTHAELELSSDMKPIGVTAAALAERIFPEGKDLTPEIPR
jgi:hypothetical protein